MNGAVGRRAVMFAIALAVACSAAIAAGWDEHPSAAAWWSAAAIWGLGGAFVLHQGPARWPSLPAALRLSIGFVGLWAAWLALSHARLVGLNFLFSVFFLVWVADIAAYFGGRRFGRRKLAPSISPGKSWEGVWSGMAAVLAVALLWHGWLDPRVAAAGGPSLFGNLLQAAGLAGAALLLLVLAGMSVVGDLIESLVKRAAGRKDSSRLLPGHGGVLDRIDALLPVFPVSLAFTGL
jgi:phosphatidate cytidylyltransferase